MENRQKVDAAELVQGRGSGRRTKKRDKEGRGGGSIIFHQSESASLFLHSREEKISRAGRAQRDERASA